MLRLLTYSTVLVALSLLLSAPARSQQPAPPASAPVVAPAAFLDTADGLKALLDDVVATARAGDEKKLSDMIKAMEIPNYEQWFSEAYGADEAKKWSDSYGSELAAHEDQFLDLCFQLADENADIETRKVDVAAETDDHGEQHAFGGLKQPIDIYFADSKDTGTPNSSSGTIGYFFFIDGQFRWDSTIMFVRLMHIGNSQSQDTPPNPDQPPTQTPDSASAASPPTSDHGPFQAGVGGVGFPRCLFCPAAQYSQEARAAKLAGTVHLSATVQLNGHATDIKIVQGTGSVLDELAIEAVEKWRLRPAPGPNGQPVAATVKIDVTFSSN
jgi:TonB family protein